MAGEKRRTAQGWALRINPERAQAARDGGWWVLALSDARAATTLTGVRMSQPDTFERTHDALTAAGQTVRVAHPLTDVDTLAEALLARES